MKKPPRQPDEPILSRGNAMIIFGVAIFMSLISFIIFVSQDPVNNIDKARTMVFASIVVMVIVGTYNFRSLRESIFVTGIFNNLFLFIGVSIIALVSLFVIYFEPSHHLFALTSLTAKDWLICISAAAINLAYVETLKYFRRRLEAR